MFDYYWTKQIDNSVSLSIAPIIDQDFDESLKEILLDDYGYFLFKNDKRTPSAGIEILAKFASEEAASEMARFHGMTLMAACE